MIPSSIVAFGGSNLFGLVDPEGGGYIGRLKVWHEKKDINNRVFNLGISGDTTAGILKRLIPEASIRKPDIILITTGLNDTIRAVNKTAPTRTPLSKFRENISDLINQAKAIADVAFISAFPVDEEKTIPLVSSDKRINFLLSDAITYTNAVKEICEEDKVAYLDIFNDWLQKDYKQWLFRDGLHANSIGHIIIFEELKSFLMKLYPN
jgi:lysophospholipase L1-like esterase